MPKALIERETLDSDEIRADAWKGARAPAGAAGVIIPSHADKDKAAKEKRKVASIFGGPPKPATSG